jgi:hypothetical protein
LEVLTPRRIGWGDAKRRRWDEAEARVVVGVAQEHDEWIVECVRGAEDGVHERVADVAALVLGEHADRTEPDRRRVVDGAFRADDVSDHLAGAGLGYERQRWDPPSVGSQSADETDLHRLGTRGRHSRERQAVDVIDALDVVREFTTDQHAT